MTTEPVEKKTFSFRRVLIGVGIMVVIYIPILIIGIFSPSSITPSTSTDSSTTTTQSPKIGDTAYLRLPSGQLVCLGQTKDDYDKVESALSSKDFLGLTEIPGAFCVHVGTKVLVIGKSWTTTQVRITETYNDTDSDKFGMSGWTDAEWVSKQ